MEIKYLLTYLLTYWQSMRGELVSLPGQALVTQTLSIKAWEERAEGDGSDVIICAFTPDHGEESLLLPWDNPQ